MFIAKGCGGCHAPPLYTNNKLLPVPGLEIPPAEEKSALIAFLKTL